MDGIYIENNKSIFRFCRICAEHKNSVKNKKGLEKSIAKEYNVCTSDFDLRRLL